MSGPRHVTSVLALKKEFIRSARGVLRGHTITVGAEGWAWLTEVRGGKVWIRDGPAQVGSRCS